MIRVNSFFELKPGCTDVLHMTHVWCELAEKSRADAGCVGYDVMCSLSNPRAMMFCETWQSRQALDAHAATPHFTRIVPLIKACTVAGTKVNKFEF